MNTLVSVKSLTPPPLVVIVGPTASGKSELAIKLAQEYHGEIICADSRSVYKGLDIGTAKPSNHDQVRVPHWGLDLVEPNQPFNAAEFKDYAVTKIKEIRDRGHVPFLVGGTGLYIDAVVFDYIFGTKADLQRREHFYQLSIEELHEYCAHNNIKLPENNRNKRHVVRFIERNGVQTTRRQLPVEDCYIVGITTDNDVLRARIAKRAEHIFSEGVVEEAIAIGNKYGWDNEAMTANIYPLIHAHTRGEITLNYTIEKFTTLDWRLAKRQLTWFRRNPYIKWLTLAEASAYIATVLAKV